MKVNLSEAKSRLSAHLLLAEKGDVVITRYEQPVSVLKALPRERPVLSELCASAVQIGGH